MKFQSTLNIWALSDEQIKQLQPGQWVSAGPVDAAGRNRGTFCGVRSSGSVVVAWAGNMRTHKDRQGYRKALMAYARG